MVSVSTGREAGSWALGCSAQSRRRPLPPRWHSICAGFNLRRPELIARLILLVGLKERDGKLAILELTTPIGVKVCVRVRLVHSDALPRIPLRRTDGERNGCDD